MAFATVLVAVLAWISTDHFRSFGGAPAGERLERMRASARFVGGKFQNAEPTALMGAGALGSGQALAVRQGDARADLPAAAGDRRGAAPGGRAASGLRITWLGHSSTIIEIDGARILTDPMWGERASPSRWVGPRRYAPAAAGACAICHRMDAVLISHEHYDHLDMATVEALGARGVIFHVPLGVGAHLRPGAFAADAHRRARLVAGRDICRTVCGSISTPARHFNGRGIPWRVGALWTSWSIVGPRHRVFFSGDTGSDRRLLRDRAARGAVRRGDAGDRASTTRAGGSIHLGPRARWRRWRAFGAKTLVPIHWATFVLAYHDWSEPAETLLENGWPARRLRC